jgi:putative transposase
MIKSYKFKIRRPSKRIVQEFEQTLEVCRELYNAALQERRDAWKVCRKNITYYDQAKELTEVRQVREDVRAIPAVVARSPLDRIDKAFKAFFGRVKKNKTKAGYPRFKSKSRYNSFTYMQKEGFKLQNNKLKLSKIGSMRLHLSREIEGKIKTCTIKRQVDGWFVIFAVEENQSPYIPKTGNTVGIDVGIENFATLSTGEVVENPKYLRKAERNLKTAHRNVSRKKRGGANRKKAVRLLAKKHLKVANQRQDFFHKTSLNLIRKFDEFAVEDLNIQGMVKNHHLAKSISDAAWGTFILILTSKAESAGRRVWKVPAAYTSQDCSRCGNRVKKSLSQREHRCIACGLVVHRDHNSAITIKGRADLLGMEKVTSPDEPNISL